MNKKCSICKETKQEKEYNKRNSNKDGLSSFCRTCAQEKLRKFRQEHQKEYNNKSLKWYENNRDLVRQRRRQSAYGISEQKFNALLKIQENKCAICKTIHDPSLYKNWKVLSVDHNHLCCATTPTCGKCNRGLLCHKCNKGIGLLGDSIELLQIAIRYLQSPPINKIKD
jgi:hypothetical protein